MSSPLASPPLAAPIALRNQAQRLVDGTLPLRCASGPGRPLDRKASPPPQRSSASPMGQYRQTSQNPSHESLESIRLKGYTLDYPDNDVKRLQLDRTSRFYAREKPRTLDLPGLMPYDTETPQSQARYLSHIVSHLYIAIKTLDLQGLLVVSPKDLVALKDTPGFSDVQLAMDTGLFQFESAPYEAIEDEADEDEDEGVCLSSTAVVGSPLSSAVVSVRHWTNELNVWMKMKFDMPVTLRVSLARVYYSLCLSRGQSLYLPTFINMFGQLVKNKRLVLKAGLRLPWEPLYREFANEFPKYDALVDDIETKGHADLLTLGVTANPFFTDCTGEVFKTVMATFSLLNAALTLSTLYGLLPCTFEPGNDVRDYLPSIFNVWATTIKTKGTDGHVTGLLGRIAEAYIAHIVTLKSNNHSASTTAAKDNTQAGVVSGIGLSTRNADSGHGVGLEGGERSGGSTLTTPTSWGSATTGTSAHPPSALGSTSDDVVDDRMGVFTPDQMSTIFNILINSLSINPSLLNPLPSSHLFHGFACAIVFSIHGSTALIPGSPLDHIARLVNSINTYNHPSNSGAWTGPLTNLLESLIYQFHKRVNQEKTTLSALPEAVKLTSSVIARFITVLLPVVLTGLQSKKDSVSNTFVHALALLTDMNPLLVLDSALIDIYASLEGVISSHRVHSAMKVLASLMRYMAVSPVYRVHVTRILTMVLPGIDSNDLFKTLYTLNIFTTTASFVPFADLTDGLLDTSSAMLFIQQHLEYLSMAKIYHGKPEMADFGFADGFPYDTAFELESLKSSTSAFSEIVRLFFERTYVLLDNLTDPEKSKGGLEKAVISTLPKCVNQMFEAMPDASFHTVAQEFFAHIQSSTLHHSTAEAVSEIVGFIVKREPAFGAKFVTYLIPEIVQAVEDGAGAKRTGSEIIPRDEPLYCRALILNSCVENSGSHLLEFQTELLALLRMMMTVKGPSIYITTYLIHQMLYTVSTIRLAETRLIAPAYVQEHGYTVDCWGGFQFSDERFSPGNLTFSWHLPTVEEVSFAIGMFEDVVETALANLDRLMETSTDNHGPLGLTDDFRHNLLCISHALSGVALLMDPMYDQKSAKTDTSGDLQSRLMVLKQLRASGGGASTPQEWLFDDSGINTPLVAPNEEVHPQAGDDGASGDSGLSASPPLESTPLITSPSTPLLEETDISLMNPAYTARDPQMYSSSYFFALVRGAAAETLEEALVDTKLRLSLYHKLHRVRAKVGRHLDSICSYLLSHHENDIMLFKIYLHSLTTWFYDVGFDTSHEQKTAGYRYIHTIQHINRVRKPFTRSGFGARLELYHRQRAVIHASSRVATALDKRLIEKAAELCNSVYTDISRSAQVAMSKIMKKVLGSYLHFMAVTFKHMADSIALNDHNRIESGLRSFGHKGVKRKISADFNNVNQYVHVLLQCMAVDNDRVAELAQKLYRSFSKHLRIPSSICLLDEGVECIKPCDDLIAMEVRAVQLAKQGKRKAYFARLADLELMVVESQHTTKHWKSTLLNIKLLCAIQQDLEIPSRFEVLELLLRESTNPHPDISRACVRGLNSLLTKFEELSLYGYDLSRFADLTCLPQDAVSVSTASSKSFTEVLNAEWESATPAFYYDNKLSTGWLFWGEELVVARPDLFYLLALSAHDESVLRRFGLLLTKEWLLLLIQVVVEENEERATFQGTDVFLFRLVIQLISAGYALNILFVELIDVVSETYTKDEKNVHVVVCEMVAGFLIAAKYTAPEYVEMRDTFLTTLLARVFERDLSPENKGVWNILCWWVPSHCDVRRFPAVAAMFFNFRLDKTSDSAFIEASRLSYVKTFVNSVTWKFNGAALLFDECFRNLDHPYQAVREQVANLATVLIYTNFNTSYAGVREYLEANSLNSLGEEPFALGQSAQRFMARVFEQVEAWRPETETMTAQEVLQSPYFRGSRTLLYMLKQVALTSASIVLERYLVRYIWPFLMHLSGLKDVCKLANLNPPRVFLRLAQLPFRASMLEAIVENLQTTVATSPTKQSLMVVSAFAQILYFKNAFLLTPDLKQRLFTLVSSLCFSKILEVRESAASTLSGMVHLSASLETDFVAQVLETYTAILRLKPKGKISSDEAVRVHGATVGLGSLINAFPYASPPPQWVPQALSSLARYASGVQGVVGKTAKDILSNFKKTRHDSWEVDSQSFTTEQLEDLEGVLWKSYFI